MRTIRILFMLYVLAPSITQATDPEQKLIKLGKQVEKRVVTLRGLESKKPIIWKMTTKPQVRSYLIKTIDEQYKPGELENEADMLKALRLIPRELDLRKFMVSLYEEQAGGYYDPIKEVFYLADWISPLFQEAIISHELTHALQDQHFGLDKLTQRIKGNSDAMYAQMAVVEGEAMLVMMVDTMKKTGLELDLDSIDMDNPLNKMLMSWSQDQMPEFANAPKAMRELMMFPYLKGLTFVSYGRSRGGWKRINKLYKDLPQSTEQILHPEKYFIRRDPPTSVSLDFLDQVMPTEWKKCNQDTLGEFMTIQLLNCLSDESEIKEAAFGWDGDKLIAYKKGDELAWIQLSVWDSEQDAVEYAGAYAKALPCRKTGYSRMPLDKEPKMIWTDTQGRTILVERKGKKVLIAEDFEPVVMEKIRIAFPK